MTKPYVLRPWTGMVPDKLATITATVKNETSAPVVARLECFMSDEEIALRSVLPKGVRVVSVKIEAGADQGALELALPDGRRVKVPFERALAEQLEAHRLEDTDGS